MREIPEVFDEAGVEVTVDALAPWSFLDATSSAQADADAFLILCIARIVAATSHPGGSAPAGQLTSAVR